MTALGQVLHTAGAYPGFNHVKWLEAFLLPLDGLRRVTLNTKFAGTHLHTWLLTGTMRVNCLGQEHNAVTPERALTRTARSRVQMTNNWQATKTALSNSSTGVRLVGSSAKTCRERKTRGLGQKRHFWTKPPAFRLALFSAVPQLQLDA